MTEADWLTATDPAPMLALLDSKSGDRLLRLFAVACCRAVWDETWPLSCRRCVETAERFADGTVTDSELNRSRSLASQAAQNAIERVHRSRGRPPDTGLVGRFPLAADAALKPAHLAWGWTRSYSVGLFRSDSSLRNVVPKLLRDIFGNPFRTVAFDLSWRSETAVALAAGIYADRAFDRMPILADALEEAGCDDVDVLSHCRGPGPHVRGCWVVDRVLGKE